jgi:hypothetical protein
MKYILYNNYNLIVKYKIEFIIDNFLSDELNILNTFIHKL